MRAAIVLRQSVRKDGSESLDMQEGACRGKAAELGADVVMVARDPAVSAFKVHPMKRPKLKAVFDAGERLDVLIYYRQARCFRRTLPDFADVVEWATEHDVLLVSATESLGDPREHASLLVPLITSWTDQGDSETKSRIFSDLYARYRAEGRWTGGKPAYGYRSAQAGPKRHDLAVDEPAAMVVRDAAARVLRGESMNSICADLNRRGVFSPANRLRLNMLERDGREYAGKIIFRDDGTGRRWVAGPWNRDSLSLILRSPAMTGRAVHHGREVLDEDGEPVVIAEPLISVEEWGRVKAMLGDRVMPRRTQGSALLLRVAYCFADGLPLYRLRSVSRGKTYVYYRCAAECRPDRYPQGCVSAPIPAKWLDETAERLFLKEVGSEKITRRIARDGGETRKQVASLGRKIIRLTTEEIEDQADHGVQIAALKAELAALRGKEDPGQVAVIITGRTFADAWKAAEPVERRGLMISAGFRIRAAKISGQVIVTHEIVSDLRERARAAAEGHPLGTEKAARGHGQADGQPLVHVLAARPGRVSKVDDLVENSRRHHGPPPSPVGYRR